MGAVRRLETAPEPRRDLDAERAVLAAVMLDNATLARLESLVAPEDFHHPGHAVVWQAMARLGREGTPIDVQTLASAVGADVLRSYGGNQFLGELTDTIPTVAHCEAHARIVADHAAARRATDLLERALLTLRDRSRTSPDALALAAAHAAELSATRRGELPRHVSSHVEQALEDLQWALDYGSTGLTTGLPSLDGDQELPGLTAGMHPRQVWVIAGDTGSGKTSFAMQVARHVAERGRGVLVVSQEMGGDELVWRWACADLGVDSRLVRSGRIGPEDQGRIFAHAQTLARLPVWIEDRTATLADVRAKALTLRAQGRDLGLLVIDYLQILAVPTELARAQRVQQLEELTRGVKRLARELRVPVLLLSQLSRASFARSGPPTRHDLRGSGSIEQDADVIALLHARVERDANGAELRQPVERVDLILDKHRQGETGTVALEFVRSQTRFREVGAE